MELSALVVGGISAIAAVVQAWKAARDIHSELSETDIDEMYREADKDLQMVGRTQSGSTVSAAADALQQVIDEGILDVMRGNIEKARERLKRALASPANSSEAKDAEVDVAAATICDELSRIRRLNGGRFPHEKFKRDWHQFGCGN